MNTLKKLKGIRIQQKMSQRELGEKIGISKQYISNIEQGRHKPSLEVTEKIAIALGFRVELLLEDGNFTEILKEEKNEID